MFCVFLCSLFRITYWESVSNLVGPSGIVVSPFLLETF
jgi:hypothetical protein